MKNNTLHVRKVVTMIIMLVIVIAVVWAVLDAAEDKKARSLAGGFEVGSTAPEFEVTNMQGEQVQLQDYLGKKVIMNFWASWCEPCVREMPLIYDIYQSGGQDTEVLFVNVGESKGTIAEFLEDHKFDFPVIIDATGKVSNLYRVSGLPTTVTIDKQGQLEQVITGEITDYSMLE
ncbi:redoxin domain-containing protein [Paenibacillus sp. PDC88]|uniref:redoxin domain-containing protein n=1 Tax=Paenibacillus sp. PDC88 TaxID=1884375 RepID=UPI00089B5043|nr:redoxin domain-containing protein [Paenibacillus sp. PDC88]SDW74118.1 Peroxiredoxin [Paenibacillus sp. PDC88]